MLHKARKRFGQNFLQDDGVIQQILRHVNAKPGQHIVEIGPGQGAITQGLVDTGANITAIEIDRDLISYLRVAFASRDNFTIIDSDALKIDFSALAPADTKLRIVGNLPYNISTPLIFHLLSHRHVIQDMYFMLQKEVVDRMAAEPNTKAYGRLSIMTQYLCEVLPIIDVPAECFNPAPKVQSAVVKLRIRPYSGTPLIRTETLNTVVATAFQQRRKTLSNALKLLLSSDQIQALGIDPRVRPDTLSIDNYIQLANAINEAE